MKIRYILASFCLMVTSAQAKEMVVYRWDDVCNYSTTTTWFTLDPKQSATIEVNLDGCTEQQIGSLLFFGNYGTKTHSRQLSSRHKVRLHLTALYSSRNVAESMISSDSGSILADLVRVAERDSLNAPICVLTAENMNRNKAVTIRLRAHLFGN